MKTRKLVLIIADAILLIALILQLALKAGDKVKIYSLKDEPDEITLTTPTEKLTFVKEGDKWLVGDKKYGTNESYVSNLITAISSIKILDKVATANNDVTLNRYELVEGKSISVEAKKGGKTIRSVVVGKNSTASTQSYVLIDGGKDIYLSSGNLKGAVDRDLNYFRTREVYYVQKNDISSVTMKPVNGNSWTVTRTGVGESTAWTINVPDVLVDATKATEWFNSLAAISTPTWHDDGELQGNKVVSAEINCGAKVIKMDIYEIPAATEEDKPIFFGNCSEAPYQFELASYSVQKFQKTVEDIIQ